MTNKEKDYFNIISSFGVVIGVFASIFMEMFSRYLVKPSQGTSIYWAWFALDVIVFTCILVFGKILSRKLFEKLIEKSSD